MPVEEVRVARFADMQFVGQTHLLRVPLGTDLPSRDDLQIRFERAYHDRFHVALPEIRANLVNVATSVVGRRAEIDLSALIDPAGRRASLDAARRTTRPVWFDGGFRDTPVYVRDHLPLDAVVAGPAIVEQMDTTIVLEPGDVGTQDGDGNLIVTVGA